MSTPLLGPVVPDVNVVNMPFIFRDQAHMRAVIDGEVGDKKSYDPRSYLKKGEASLCVEGDGAVVVLIGAEQEAGGAALAGVVYVLRHVSLRSLAISYALFQASWGVLVVAVPVVVVAT